MELVEEQGGDSQKHPGRDDGGLSKVQMRKTCRDIWDECRWK